MSDYFLGEIRLFAFNWAPQDWALCDGASLPVQQNAALFSLIHNFYGGDGKTNFLLPDFRGRTAYGMGRPVYNPSAVYNVGTAAGAETVAITTATMPAHTHDAAAVTSKNTTAINPAKGGALYAQEASPVNIYAPPAAPLLALNPETIGNTGGGRPHQNMQPFTVLNFCIALRGLYPARQ